MNQNLVRDKYPLRQVGIALVTRIDCCIVIFVELLLTAFFKYFQVLVTVVEGRQLEGQNLYPLVKISIGNSSYQTRVKESTNRPLYDEVTDTLEEFHSRNCMMSASLIFTLLKWLPNKKLNAINR